MNKSINDNKEDKRLVIPIEEFNVLNDKRPVIPIEEFQMKKDERLVIPIEEFIGNNDNRLVIPIEEFKGNKDDIKSIDDIIKQEVSNGSKSKEKKYHKKIGFLFMKLALAIIMIFSMSNIALYYIDIEKNDKLSNKLVEEIINNNVKNEDLTTTKIDFNKLLSINEDTKGWIIFNNNKINYPVVQSSDNDYYLKKTFDKKNNQVGAIFLDYRNNNFNDQNTIIYGHAMQNDSMFGSMIDIYESGFFTKKDNNYITLINVNNEKLVYQIFSYYIIEKEDYYITTRFNNNEEYKQFINTIKNRSKSKINVDVTEKDKILTLSTCYGVGNTSKRSVIHAKYIGDS